MLLITGTYVTATLKIICSYQVTQYVHSISCATYRVSTVWTQNTVREVLCDKHNATAYEGDGAVTL